MRVGYSKCILGLVLVAGAFGCSSGGGGGGGAPDGGGATGGSGGTGGATGGSGGAGMGGDGGGGTGGSSGAAGSGGGAPAFASNTPSASVTQTADGDAAGLVVTSCNLVDEVSGSEYFQRWIGLIQNTGTNIVCYPQVNAQFLAGATEVANHDAFASTPPYKTGTSTLTSSCLGPGEIGGFYSNGFAPTALDLASIDQIVLTITASIFPGTVAHPFPPTFANVQLAELFGAGSGYWSATGTLTATGTIYNISIDAFPVGADSLVPNRLGDTYLDTLATGSSYDFETTTYEGSKATGAIHTFADFLEGSALIVTPDPEQFGFGDRELVARARAALTPAEKHEIWRELRRRQTARAHVFRARQ